MKEHGGIQGNEKSKQWGVRGQTSNRVQIRNKAKDSSG